MGVATGQGPERASGLTTGSTHMVPNPIPGAPNQGAIIGGGGDDVLIGDPGGAEGIDGNFIFVLDSSGSMTTEISFNDGTISRQQAQQNAVNAALDQLATSGAANIRVHLIEFDSDANSLGTFNIVSGGVVNQIALDAAHAAVNSVDANGVTNYEAGLQQAINYITPGTPVTDVPLPGATVNQFIFLSDGQPNRALEGDSISMSDVVTVGVPAALQHLTGTFPGNPGGEDEDSPTTADTVSEISIIETDSDGAGPDIEFTIEAVGINVGETAWDILDQVEGEPAGDPGPPANRTHSADNITTAEQLTDTISALTAVLNDVGANLSRLGALRHGSGKMG